MKLRLYLSVALIVPLLFSCASMAATGNKKDDFLTSIDSLPLPGNNKPDDSMTSATTQINWLKKQNQLLAERLAIEKQKARKARLVATEQLANLQQQLKQFNAAELTPTTTLTEESDNKSYALGILWSQEIKKMLQKNSDLGVQIKFPQFISGIKDGYNGTTLLSEEKAKEIGAQINQTLASSYQKNTEKSQNILSAALAKQTPVASQNGVSVVITRQGEKTINKDDVVTFNLAENQLGGAAISDTQTHQLSYEDTLPFFLSESFAKAGHGGTTEIYGLAKNLYTPEAMPPGVTPETPMIFKIEIN